MSVTKVMSWRIWRRIVCIAVKGHGLAIFQFVCQSMRMAKKRRKMKVSTLFDLFVKSSENIP